ncbi:Uncharacterised protein [Mycobacterium tuberculosis]|nr:Uncharacterised protein [Mycobacterium tuberculosis]
MGVSALGMNARAEVTLMIVACGLARNDGSNAAVSRIGPSRLIPMVSSAAPGPGAVRSSTRWMPALLTTTLSAG